MRTLGRGNGCGMTIGTLCHKRCLYEALRAIKQELFSQGALFQRSYFSERELFAPKEFVPPENEGLCQTRAGIRAALV